MDISGSDYHIDPSKKISPADITFVPVFADFNGIAVIPNKIEQKATEKVINAVYCYCRSSFFRTGIFVALALVTNEQSYNHFFGDPDSFVHRNRL